MPNITGTTMISAGRDSYICFTNSTNAFYATNVNEYRPNLTIESAFTGAATLNIDASHSHTIYTTGCENVIPSSVNMYYVIKY